MKDSDKQSIHSRSPRQMSVSTPDNCSQIQRRSQRHRRPPLIGLLIFVATHSEHFQAAGGIVVYWPLSHSDLWTIVCFVKLSYTSICNINCYDYYCLLATDFCMLLIASHMNSCCLNSLVSNLIITFNLLSGYAYGAINFNQQIPNSGYRWRTVLSFRLMAGS